jgi:hypothetical protein
MPGNQVIFIKVHKRKENIKYLGVGDRGHGPYTDYRKSQTHCGEWTLLHK